ncbi:response regulator [Arenibaculum pallidiluteum]|uniref:response regulator n=1 Tax=Arenibaculum pallidiluteum TaxID=2812559 RepID=UPI001A97695F|nr:response regulator [Arenibaculum pallidiluteum]
MKLIVIEDDRLVGPAVQAVLEREGYDVLGVATTAAKALRLARQHEPDLALVDLRLGKGDDGLATARRLREDCGVPALIMTGFDLRAEEARGAALGILRKPMAPHDLVQAVESVRALLAGDAPDRIPRGLELL